MLNRSVAIGMMAMPTLIVGCGGNPVLPDRSTSEESDASVSAFAVAAPAAVCVPFKVNGNPGSVQVTGGPPPAPLNLTISAEGQATHLGQYSSTANAVVTFTSPTTAVFDGGGTFTAADGDDLAFTYTGDFLPGPVAGGHGTYVIAGGTGRFEGATGSGVFNSEGGQTTFDGDVCFARAR
ncbi:MAG: hypothetical protein P8188_20740 [Gemmatimonadota bacterium]|jgi:hypothetical protein